MVEHYWWWPLEWVPLFMPFFWLLVAALCLYFIFGRRRSWEPGPGPQARETALDILKKRYAKGEITKEEFERMKRDILG
jgi:putative membrane protein